MAKPDPPRFTRDDVVRLWFERQRLTRPRGERKLTKRPFVDLLEATGGLQVDSVNVLDRAHYLTLWSRFGPYTRKRVDRWIGERGVAYEYWGHEASILPLVHLPLSRRRMRRFPGRWKDAAWWPRFDTTQSSRRRVLRRIRAEGPLESGHFERRESENDTSFRAWAGAEIPKEDQRSLRLLWHAGRLAVRERRHFRRVYDLAERVYPDGEVASTRAYEDSWWRAGLAGNGIATEKHLVNYFTTPNLDAATRRAVIARGLKARDIVEVRVDDSKERWFARPEDLDALARTAPARGTSLLCPFDSLLWQRRRAEELLDFSYRIEIYVPPKKRKFGYYAMPILHDGALVGLVDPKLHRDRETLELKSIRTEPGFDGGRSFRRGLRETLESLATFVGADDIELPRAWRRKL